MDTVVVIIETKPDEKMTWVFTPNELEDSHTIREACEEVADALETAIREINRQPAE